MDMRKQIVIGLSCLTALWAGGFATFSLNTMNRSAEAFEQTSDAIVVLTGGKNRIYEGLTLFASGRSTNLLITGVHKDVKGADILGAWSGENDLPSCCITLDYEAKTTRQNALETQKWIADGGHRSIRLVTSDYHMTRALMEFQHVMPELEIYVHPVLEKGKATSSPEFWYLLVSEYHKTVIRKISLTLMSS